MAGPADTIFALSSGAPPSAIAVIRVSGPSASDALLALAGSVPEPRRAALRALRGGDGAVLDHALVLWFPGPKTATGEDLAEFHLHGGRAVVKAVEGALAALSGLRHAEAGEFTRRAFANGRIDLAEAEGLADLLSAETELQRRNAIAISGGIFSKIIAEWTARLLALSAEVETALDFSDEGDVGELPPELPFAISTFADELAEWLQRPRAERLRAGFRVVLAGPPNAGKSSLFNALLEEDAAIATPIAGTTRDILERDVVMDGAVLTLIDTAGLHDDTDDQIEAIGIARAEAAVAAADLVLWLGPVGDAPAGSWAIAAKSDLGAAAGEGIRKISAHTGEGVADLRRDMAALAASQLPRPGMIAVNARQHALIERAHEALVLCQGQTDLLIIGEGLRAARTAFDALTGKSSTEEMLDALFGRFCIGK